MATVVQAITVQAVKEQPIVTELQMICSKIKVTKVKKKRRATIQEMKKKMMSFSSTTYTKMESKVTEVPLIQALLMLMAEG